MFWRRRKSGNGTSASQHLYVMVNLPFVWAWKVGVSKSATRRAWELSRKLPGIMIPVAWVAMPFAYQHEQFLLRITKKARTQIFGQGGKELRHALVGVFLMLWVWVLLATKYTLAFFITYRIVEYAAHQ